MSNSANTRNENIKKEKEAKKIEIEVFDHPEFEFNFKSCFTNTIELADVVDSLFGKSMRDYAGCKICFNKGEFDQSIIPNGKFYVELYFKDRSGTSEEYPINNLIKRSDAFKDSSKFSVLCNMTGANSGRSYEVTKETYEALNKFRFYPERNINWEKVLTTEKVSSYGYIGNYNQEIMVRITGIDLEKIIEEVYGHRTEDGVFEYQVIPAQIVANTSGEFVVQINQLDVNKLNDLRKVLGGPTNMEEFHRYVR